MKKIPLSAFAILSLLASCNKKPMDVSSVNVKTIEQIYDSESNLKRAFGKALLSSMKESPMLRFLIKTEAQKMFDKDYEVLYYMIRDKKLENNVSVEELLVKHVGGKVKLDEILAKFPTLTILIPELPYGSFSANMWDADNIAPAVAIRTDKSNDIPYIKTDGSEDVIPGGLTPGFPVIVVGINERIISNIQSGDFDNYDTKIVYNNNGVKLRFWSDNFDNSVKVLARGTNTLDQKVIDAYNIYQGTDGWQRDYIYYGIKPTSPNGSFSYSFKEHLTSFMVGTPTTGMAAYQKISDQTGDPFIITPVTSATASHWTSGHYEFKVKTKINGKNGVGDEIINGFSANPTDLFDLTYTQSPSGNLYNLTTVTPKRLAITLPIFNWRLEDYSTSVKLSFEEVDIPTTTVTTESRTSKYAANFDISATILKIGLKLGASAEVTNTKSTQTTMTQGSDDLYEAIVNFGDKVIITENPTTIGNGKPSMEPHWVTQEYSTGMCSFSMEPLKVQ